MQYFFATCFEKIAVVIFRLPYYDALFEVLVLIMSEDNCDLLKHRAYSKKFTAWKR